MNLSSYERKKRGHEKQDIAKSWHVITANRGIDVQAYQYHVMPLTVRRYQGFGFTGLSI